jgi:hypothetical protein
MKKIAKKLTLSKEVVRALVDTDLDSIHGGRPKLPTQTCGGCGTVSQACTQIPCNPVTQLCSFGC